MRTRRTNDVKKSWRREQHLEIDVGSRLDVIIEESDVMGENAELELVDDLVLGGRRWRGGR